LSKMYMLVSKVSDGLSELKSRFEAHVHSQGLAAIIEKCGEVASNVSWELAGSGHGELKGSGGGVWMIAWG